jgi:hypothetical protein
MGCTKKRVPVQRSAFGSSNVGVLEKAQVKANWLNAKMGCKTKESRCNDLRLAAAMLVHLKYHK